MNENYYINQVAKYKDEKSYLEAANCIKEYARHSKHNNKVIADKLSMSQSAVSEYLRVSSIPSFVQGVIREQYPEVSLGVLLKVSNRKITEAQKLGILAATKKVESVPRNRATFEENLIKRCKQLVSELDVAAQKMNYQGEFEGLKDSLRNLREKIDQVLNHESAMDQVVDDLVGDIIN